ncbi:MAG: DUF86 domain-containing protein [Myxococcales bacterium]|nr:DUF86 domain-containing protein [Myxococcales bacterium]
MSPGAVDAVLVARHLSALRAAAANLRRHRGKPVEALLANLDETWVVLHGLQLCAQNAVDVATHLVAASGVEAADYRSAVEGLARIGALPADFALRFADVAGFRNILVHAYLEVDLRRVHKLLDERLEDFERFADHVEAWLASGHEGGDRST